MKNYSYLIILLIISCTAKTKTPITEIEQLVNDITFLASDSLEGREIGTQGEIIAADYIAKRFKEIGLTAKGDSNSYFQLFNRKQKAHPHDTAFMGEELTGRNVLGYIDNGANNTVVIGAHYDHLGWGDEGSLFTDSVKAIHNGADDNASGIAALLNIAKELKGKKSNNNFLFIAFTGEEKGLWGSNYFVKNATVDIEKVNFMINMDMVGRLDSNRRLAIHGVGTSPEFIPAIESIKTPEFKIKYDSSGVGPSDHTSFYLADVPVVHFFTGQHEDYHKPSDDVDFINFEGLKDVSDFILILIANLEGPEAIPFTKTKEESNKGRSFNVTLGVIPDYLYDDKGMKIDGTKEGRPANKAGIIKGDVVIKMGELTINTMNDYMDALGVFEAGMEIELIVKRGEEKITKQVVFD
jgi:hypothetical protein